MKTVFKVFILGLLVALIGCGGAKVKRDKPADVIYKEAMDFFEHKKYEDAIAAFQELAAKYPLSKFAVEAKLKIADSNYKNESYPEAISAYREFEKLHPTNDNIPYVIFQIGMSYFDQMLTTDRDQTATINAATEFARLISGFPDNQYALKARTNLAIARKNLAENEFYVGSFYLRKSNYKAALERFYAVMNKYPEFEGMDKILFYAGKTHIEIGEKDKGESLLNKLLTSYPDSKFAVKSKDILGTK